MTGERMMWHQIAARLHMSKERAQRETTSSQFMDWWYFLQWEYNNPSRGDFYLMQVAQEVHCVLMKRSDRKKVKLKDFIIKLIFGAPEDKPKPVRKIEIEEMPDAEESLSDFEKMIQAEEEDKRKRAEHAAKAKAAWGRIFPVKEKKDGT